MSVGIVYVEIRDIQGDVRILRKESGCKCVEMEAAALFAVARFRNVAQILYAGDDLSGDFGDSRNWSDRQAIREELLELPASPYE
ncbi:MAG: hypothetical protein GQ565_08235 [Candidatus Aegiribacteria sp.]|nr:hypothetical protein [Candidatus Aegiribacteria sp.]